jgi:2-C-methyl-D-erythritol 4-phosphate cytidylyltransferase / 2-C-methyl-D-erythritol 2,4-cyclodiphosphate synthase
MSAKISVIIVAAGRGSRYSIALPKQYELIYGKTILRHTIDVFLSHPSTKDITCVIHPDDIDLYTQSVTGLNISYVFGGETRQDSVISGLKALKNTDLVFIHDAARPNLTIDKIDALIESFEDSTTCGAILALPVVDTVKYVENGFIVKTLDRQNVFRAQTPQVFRFDTIYTCHVKAPHQNFTDDAALLEHFNHKVKIVLGDAANIKITEPNDTKFMSASSMYER